MVLSLLKELRERENRAGLLYLDTAPGQPESKRGRKNPIFHSQSEVHSHRRHVFVGSGPCGIRVQLKSKRELEWGGWAALNAFTAAATASHHLKIPSSFDDDNCSSRLSPQVECFRIARAADTLSQTVVMLEVKAVLFKPARLMESPKRRLLGNKGDVCERCHSSTGYNESVKSREGGDVYDPRDQKKHRRANETEDDKRECYDTERYTGRGERRFKPFGQMWGEQEMPSHHWVAAGKHLPYMLTRYSGRSVSSWRLSSSIPHRLTRLSRLQLLLMGQKIGPASNSDSLVTCSEPPIPITPTHRVKSFDSRPTRVCTVYIPSSYQPNHR
ncbi:unnamed protein product [Pleuronectes platessa]|uniref:Uncharacterized protein n=1 Tax=Pleuronectes platessa TaxID=8262 RepID=A0A9N7TQY9_PLEPL|nr:unnamed protein product [Pleuronectes platessa]